MVCDQQITSYSAILVCTEYTNTPLENTLYIKLSINNFGKICNGDKEVFENTKYSSNEYKTLENYGY